MPQKSLPIPKTAFKFLFYTSKPYKKWVIFAVIAVIIGAILNTSVAFVFKQIIDKVSNFSPEDGTKVILFWILMYPAIQVAKEIAWRSSGLLGSRWATGAETYGYQKLFKYLSKHSQSYFDNRFAGALVSKISTAAASISSIIESILWTQLSTLIALLTTIIYTFFVDPKLSLAIIVLILILIPFNLYIVKFRKKASEDETDLYNDLKGTTTDVATNMLAVRQFAMINQESNNIKKLSELWKKAMLKSWGISEIIISLNALLISIFILAISLITYNAWVAGNVTPGDFVLIFTLISQLIFGLTFIGMSMNYFSKHVGHINASLKDIIIEHDIEDKKKAFDLKITNGAIIFDEVDFEYKEGKNVFQKLNLNIDSRQKVGLVGPSGSGKTSFIRILLRQHDLDGGVISIDGQDISEVTQKSLQENIAIVPQEPALFHRTIRENISYGQKNVTDKDIVEAAKKAEAHDFIKDLKEGYETMVGERGVKLSAGQRQRIAIARAILKNSPILILDEATSALDSESESKIQKALHNLMKEKTVIAIAHRLSTLSEMDRILVLKDGEITEDGKPKELIKQNGLYAKMWEKQNSNFLKED